MKTTIRILGLAIFILIAIFFNLCTKEETSTANVWLKYDRLYEFTSSDVAFETSYLMNKEQAVLACKSLGQEWRLPTTEEWDIIVSSNGGGYYDRLCGTTYGDPHIGYENLKVDGFTSLSLQKKGFVNANGLHVAKGYAGWYFSDGKAIWGLVLGSEYGEIIKYFPENSEEKYACRCIRKKPIEETKNKKD